MSTCRSIDTCVKLCRERLFRSANALTAPGRVAYLRLAGRLVKLARVQAVLRSDLARGGTVSTVKNCRRLLLRTRGLSRPGGVRAGRGLCAYYLARLFSGRLRPGCTAWRCRSCRRLAIWLCGWKLSRTNWTGLPIAGVCRRRVRRHRFIIILTRRSRSATVGVGLSKCLNRVCGPCRGKCFTVCSIGFLLTMRCMVFDVGGIR